MLDPNKAIYHMPIGVLSLERYYDSINDATNSSFTFDRAYFKAHKGRFLLLRRAWPGEFDNGDASIRINGSTIQPPAAIVRVMRIPNVGHIVSMVWRGPLDEPTTRDGYLISATSDAIVTAYTKKMLANGGCNWPAITAYQQLLAKAQDTHNANPFRKVNPFAKPTGKVQ